MKTLLSFLLLVGSLFSQVTPIPTSTPVNNLVGLINTNYTFITKFTTGTSIPGSCVSTNGYAFYKTDTHVWYDCNNNVFVQRGSGGGGGSSNVNFSVTLSGPGFAATINHNLNNAQPLIVCRDSSSNALTLIPVVYTDVNNLTLTGVGSGSYVCELNSSGITGATGATGPTGPAGPTTPPGYVPISVPSIGSMTWLDQGSSTAVLNSDTTVTLINPATSGRYITGLGQSVTIPYSKKLFFIPSPDVTLEVGTCIFIQETGSGKIAVNNFSPSGITINRFTNPSTFDSNIYSKIGPFISGPLAGIRIDNDGTHRTYYLSNNGGITWTQIFQESTGTYITEDFIGFAIFGDNTTITHDMLIVSFI